MGVRSYQDSIKSEEVKEALRWRVKGVFPFDAEKAVLDFDIVNEVTDEDGAKKVVPLAAQE